MARLGRCRVCFAISGAKSSAASTSIAPTHTRSRCGSQPSEKGADETMTSHLAQLNVGRLRYDVGDPRMAEFVDNLALVNGLAERSPGFVWRYQDDSGSAIDTRPFDGDPRMASTSRYGTASSRSSASYGRRGTNAFMANAMNGSSAWTSATSSCG